MPRRRSAADIPIRRRPARCPACGTGGRLPVAAWEGAYLVWCPCCGPVARVHATGHRQQLAEDLAAELVALVARGDAGPGR